jgi:hypothetical protein
LGDFHQGWMYYESRYREDKKDRTSMNVVPPNITTSQYQGESLKNKRILICAEQGIGDEIMFYFLGQFLRLFDNAFPLYKMIFAFLKEHLDCYVHQYYLN